MYRIVNFYSDDVKKGSAGDEKGPYLETGCILQKPAL